MASGNLDISSIRQLKHPASRPTQKPQNTSQNVEMTKGAETAVHGIASISETAGNLVNAILGGGGG
jgi:hypothetical protein